jgi:short-subunit dehydrogenase
MAVVVITGASSGLGEATARVLAGEGHTLVLAARRADRLEALAARLTEELAGHAEILVVPTDVADPDQVEGLIQRALERFGRIDVWVNNAGVGPASPWWEASRAEVERVIGVNFTAPLLADRALIPVLIAQGSGHIINVASVAGHIGTTGLYSATKFGVRGHTEALRRELKRYGIHVSIVSPGFVDSEMTRRHGRKLPPARIVGEAIARLIRRPRREVVVPGWYRVLIWVSRLSAALTDRVLSKQR